MVGARGRKPELLNLPIVVTGCSIAPCSAVHSMITTCALFSFIGSFILHDEISFRLLALKGYWFSDNLHLQSSIIMASC